MKKNSILDSEKEKNKSKKSNGFKVLLGFILCFIGWLSIGIGYSVALPGTLNTILFMGGLFLFFGGIIFMFI